jgi:hypothetical protein
VADGVTVAGELVAPTGVNITDGVGVPVTVHEHVTGVPAGTEVWLQPNAVILGAAGLGGGAGVGAGGGGVVGAGTDTPTPSGNSADGPLAPQVLVARTRR